MPLDCEKRDICPHITKGSNEYLNEIKDGLISVVEQLGVDIVVLEENEKEMWDLSLWVDGVIKEILLKAQDIIVSQKTIFQNTVETFEEKITNLSEEIERLKRDNLTWLLNRHTLDENYEKLISSWKIFSLALIDIDDFKNINDNYGHSTWDRVIKLISKMLIKSFWKEFVYRYGWEEFMVLIDKWEWAVKSHLDNILKLLNDKIINVDDLNKFKLTFSAGVKNYTWETNFQELLTKVDKLLYIVKKTWKNRVDIVTN